MDNALLMQLGELARACCNAGIKPIICGGLGVYLSFFKKHNEISNMIRATQDIDLMLSRQDIIEEAKRRIIADILTKDLKYVVCDNKRYHGFLKDDNRQLDILVPPVEGLVVKNHRLQIVKSTLHGYITEEAQFIDEELVSVLLCDIDNTFNDDKEIRLYVPSPTNLMIMKLYAFADRIEGTRQSSDRAIDHSWDLFISIMLTDRNDYLKSRDFLKRHCDSEIIQRAKSIVANKFSGTDCSGWQSILAASNFYPELNRKEKEVKLADAAGRLVRWFNI